MGALVLACSAQGRTVEDRWGWDYCAPPYPPECLESARATRKIDAICRTAVDTYVANVVRYRTCLAGELERAMREANDVIDSAKCLTDKANCPERKP
ncbi:MAG TPA: hypothetical protein VMU18_04295 [Rhodoblastus sp.]|nr:hypothetical protein [Rhodoblastus sp.]